MDKIAAIIDRLERELDQLKKAVYERDQKIDDPGNTLVPLLLGKPDVCPGKEKHFEQIFFDSNPIPTILSSFEKGDIARANNAFYELTGYEKNEVTGKTTVQLGFWSDSRKRNTVLKKLKKDRTVTSCPSKIPAKTGKMMNSRAVSFLVEMNGRLCLITMFINHMAAKRTDGKCARVPIPLPENSHRFSENQIDMENMFYRSDDNDLAIYEKISEILKKNVFPFIENLKREKLDQNSHAYIAIIETTLNTLVSFFPNVEAVFHPSLTPTEIHIMELIKQGKTSKEIAMLLNVSLAAVSFHRNNIRKKVGLHKKKISLISYLNSNQKPLGKETKPNHHP